MEFVQLELKRNRGWPWPEDSWGLDSMYGPDGWCRSCGIPLQEQTGPLTLRASGMSPVQGAWVPNWRFDTICVEATLAARLGSEYRLETRPVAWHRNVQGAAMQIIAPTIKPEWFDPDALRTAAVSRHGSAGKNCAECCVWRWLPLPLELLPRFGRRHVGTITASWRARNGSATELSLSARFLCAGNWRRRSYPRVRKTSK